jgi:hypothetical protein
VAHPSRCVRSTSACGDALQRSALQSVHSTQGRETAISMGWYFLFFFISGFCSILYELVWLRLSLARFGITTALVSIALSTFMAGLGAGSRGLGAALWRTSELPSALAVRSHGAFDRLLRACGASGIGLGARTGGMDSRTERLIICSTLSGFGRNCGADLDPVVCLHGRHNSLGDVRDLPGPTP